MIYKLPTEVSNPVNEPDDDAVLHFIEIGLDIMVSLSRNGLLADVKHRILIKNAQLSQRDRDAGCVVVLAKSGRLELGDNILRTL